MKQFLTALMLGIAALAGPALADGLTDPTPAEREAFRAEVRAYLLEHPEVLLEAIQRLEERQAAQQDTDDAALVAANADALFNDPDSWTGGNPDGAITLVEFMDYRCGYCRKAFDEVHALVEGNDDLRFVIKEFPILGEQSMLAARMAIATRQIAGDDAYKALHDELMTYGGQLTETSLAGIARKLDLDATAIMDAMDSDEVTRVISENHRLAQRMQINGTPTFVLEDRMLRGYVPLAQMERLLDAARAQVN
ncbi:disulfide bond formation protein DsbA [Maritimibacter sp. 55A14]|uniref:DsbA family protein n=1 Tax=Maritimibacter sp. 55A14 TaxID=2174844 RepID=UPI000D60747B|nr:DsbA family protein [Maritimibacter sp. 55A14]PWE30458.1 disulfide bond formation protein DsbA [Maritimibacter sp. 55A14]